MCIRDSPYAIVGEIGLDKAAKTPDTGKCEFESHQLEIFIKQLKIAHDLNRPVSVHCVRAFGWLLDFFQQFDPSTKKNKNKKKQSSTNKDSDYDLDNDIKSPELPPIIMMHSYGGSIEMMTSLLKLEKILNTTFYFSFSSVINLRSPKTLGVISAVPLDRILMESDMNSPFKLTNDMAEICKVVAKEKKLTIRETAQKCKENSLNFFDISKWNNQK
eukprot:TRINITY_DN3728_c0_g1_i1.p1 TRINITY_DN3728_c0_g1~~TRINITY_DN3728_c0_g1_i1.p1  ORF type:complete len:216 (+),score=37.86 TRINITY_DN3728_c0_g1_i1:33-680(+)